MVEELGATAANESYIAIVGSRIEAACRRIGTRTKAASVAGLSTDQLLRIVRGESVPNFIAVQAIAHAAGVSLHWIASGEGPMLREEEESLFTAQSRNVGVPVVGLTDEDGAGWFSPIHMEARASRPGDLRTPEAFAVMAPDRAMALAGILPGFLCYCDPTFSPEIGDAVFVERIDGRAALRLFEWIEGDKLALHAWPVGDGRGISSPSPLREQFERVQIKRISPVAYVKRRL